MDAVNWQELFKQSPLFSGLAEAEIAQLLTHEASQERTYVQDDLVVRAGEEGDSLFLIGAGSVQVTVWGVPVATLPAGELFGEMAVLDRKPRAATVTAKENSTLLEIKGEAFRKLLEGHPELRAKVGAKFTERVEQSRQQ
jgi:CRP-like cAMP-binding protein